MMFSIVKQRKSMFFNHNDQTKHLIGRRGSAGNWSGAEPETPGLGTNVILQGHFHAHLRKDVATFQ
jgi:hypothetical protein